MSKPMLPSGIDIAIREDLAEGASRTQTTLTIDPVITADGTRVTMATIGDIGFAKIDQGKTGEEIISFTGMTDNTTTYELTGCIWGYKFDDPSSQDTDNRKQHNSGASFQMMTDQHFIATTYVDNQTAETIEGVKTFGSFPITPSTDPTTDYQVANKKYADDLAIAGAPDATLTVKGIVEIATQSEIDAGTGTGGTGAKLVADPATLALSIYGTQLPSSDEKDALDGTGTPSTSNKYVTADTIANVPDGIKLLNAGETINGATLPVAVYQDTSDNEVYACDGNDTTKLVFLGFATTDSTDGNPIDVQVNGIVPGFTGLAEGTKYYVQDDKTIGTAVGTYEVLVGEAISETEIVIMNGRDEYIGTEAISISGTGVDATGTITMPTNGRTAILDITSFDDGAGNGDSSGEFTIKRMGITSTSMIDKYNNAGGQNEFTASISGDTITLTSVRAAGNPAATGTAYYYN